jgi:hypothetical protein
MVLLLYGRDEVDSSAYYFFVTLILACEKFTIFFCFNESNGSLNKHKLEDIRVYLSSFYLQNNNI